MATTLLSVFGFWDFEITRPACSPLASIALVLSRVVTVHSPLGASWRSVFEASGSLAMKSPWRIGRPRLPPETCGPPPAGRSTDHLESSAVPANSSDCGRQVLPPPPGGWIVKETDFGGCSTFPPRAGEGDSTRGSPRS